MPGVYNIATIDGPLQVMVSAMSAVGREAEIMCSIRAFPVVTHSGHVPDEFEGRRAGGLSNARSNQELLAQLGQAEIAGSPPTEAAMRHSQS